MDRNSEGMDSNGTPVDDFEFDNNSYTVAEMREMAANVQRENVEQPQHEPTSQRGKGRGSRGGRKESGIKPPAPPNLEKILPRKRKPEDVQPEIPGVGKRTSAVWDHFKLYPIYDKDGNVLSLRALCDHCTKEYSGKGRDGTSNCHNHLLKCKGYRKWKEEIGVDNQSEFDQQTYCEFFAEAILRHGYPLSMVENEGVRKLHSYLNPKVKPISRKTITRWCMSRHELLKGMLMETLRKIDGKVCLTTDIWNACTSRAYLALTCHYIDHKWQLKSKVLNFCHFPPPHTGNETAKLLYSMIRDWGLEKKVFSMTVDNATNMDVMTVRLQEKLQSHSPLPGNGIYFHIRCCAHILNFIVKEGLKVVDDAVSVIRENVKYIDSSEARYIRFMECVKEDTNHSKSKLWLDVPTRWNSTYLMLVRARMFKSVLDRFAENENQYPHPISPENWQSAKEICLLLQPFYRITNMFSGSEYPTSNLYFEQVCKIEFHLRRQCENSNDSICTMAKSMLEKFDKYWSQYSVVLSIAAILDPRIKTKTLSDYLSRAYCSHDICLEKYNEVKEALVNLFNEYKGSSVNSTPLALVQNATTIQNDTTIQNATESNSNTWLDDDDAFESFGPTLGSSSTHKTELDSYLDSPLSHQSSGQDFDVLVWWRDHAAEFPILSRIAKDILTIPITTVASESTFSMGGRVLNKWRASLLSTHVEALVTCRSWLFGYEDGDENVLGTEVDKNQITYEHEDDRDIEGGLDASVV